ncbi:hypothetical protein GCM10010094_87780 [Streptomyces flaveus]|uniref:Uncharacterized protein n=1 Tax=Streptomyces flaveus TaxID=66370 RepID=A0A917VTR8_9ACTN|nr:hypothetical protein GCM10010094_87780 [Streptomyces flaveus]
MRALERARCRRAAATRGEMATQFLLERVLGAVMTSRCDRGERAAHVEHAFGQVDVVPVQAEGLAFAQAGADEELEQVGHVRIGVVAVLEEPDRLGGGPDPALRRSGAPALRRGRSPQGRRAGRVVGEAVLEDGVPQRAGQRGQAPVEGGAATAGGELAGDEGGDVPVPEFVQPEAAEGGDEVVVHVVAVAGHGGRLEDQRLGCQPGVEVVGDGLVRVGVEAAGLALQERPQRGLGVVVAGEAASPDGGPVAGWGGNVDGEGPRPVVMVGEQAGAVCSELAAVGVSAAAPAVDAAAVGGGTHEDRLPEAQEGPTLPVSCDHMRPPSARACRDQYVSLGWVPRAAWGQPVAVTRCGPVVAGPRRGHDRRDQVPVREMATSVMFRGNLALAASVATRVAWPVKTLMV